MSDIRIKMAKDLRDMSDMVGDLHWMAAKAVEDLTKKDGEIAKRDARIEAQEAQIKILQSDANSWQSGYDEGRRMGAKLAAPVSEAKAQGVIDFVFSGELPNATFVEVEDGNGNSINVGEWFERDDGYSVLRLNTTPVQQVSVPDGATLILGDTGRKDLDRLIDRLMSSDPDFEDCTAAAALLRRLFMEEISGPKGHATWKDAAVAERLRRVSMRPSETVVAMAREGLAVYSGPNMNEHKVCAEIVRLADISDTAMLAAAPAAPAADAGLVEAFTTATNRLDRIALELTGHWANEATDVIAVSRAALAAHRAKGVV